MHEKINYNAVNKAVAHLVPPSANTILDIGCGNGAMGQWLKDQHPRKVDGITYSEAEAETAFTVLDNVLVADLNTFDFTSLSESYDCIICSHVLEHLYEPWVVVQKLEAALQPGGVLVVAVPNLLFWKQRWILLRGGFQYSQTGGLLDITHYRFFTWQSVSILYSNSKLLPTTKFATGMVPQAVFRRIFPVFAQKIDRWAVNRWPGLFGFQFLMVHTKSHEVID